MNTLYNQLICREWPDLHRLNAIFILCLRLWLAWVFFRAGLVKVQSWDSTLALFEYEYSVPLLSSTLAAVLAVIVELTVPVMLVIGLLIRPMIVVLLVFNYIAMSSYPDISAAGIKEHWLWQLAMMMILIQGAERYSLSAYFASRNEQSTAT